MDQIAEEEHGVQGPVGPNIGAEDQDAPLDDVPWPDVAPPIHVIDLLGDQLTVSCERVEHPDVQYTFRIGQQGMLWSTWIDYPNADNLLPQEDVPKFTFEGLEYGTAYSVKVEIHPPEEDPERPKRVSHEQRTHTRSSAGDAVERNRRLTERNNQLEQELERKRDEHEESLQRTREQEEDMNAQLEEKDRELQRTRDEAERMREQQEQSLQEAREQQDHMNAQLEERDQKLQQKRTEAERLRETYEQSLQQARDRQDSMNAQLEEKDRELQQKINEADRLREAYEQSLQQAPDYSEQFAQPPILPASAAAPPPQGQGVWSPPDSTSASASYDPSQAYPRRAPQAPTPAPVVQPATTGNNICYITVVPKRAPENTPNTLNIKLQWSPSRRLWFTKPKQFYRYDENTGDISFVQGSYERGKFYLYIDSFRAQFPNSTEIVPIRILGDNCAAQPPAYNPTFQEHAPSSPV